MNLLKKLRKGPSDEEINAKIQASTLMQEGKYDEALKLHEKYFDKKSEADWYSRGNLLTNLGKSTEAIACYTKAVQLDDGYVKAWFRLGQKYFELGHFELALNAFVQTSYAEGKKGVNEWNTVATFYYMMSLYLEYQNTKDETFGEKIPDQIRKLRPVLDIDDKTSDADFLVYCTENFQKIVDELEPKVVAEFRT